MLFIFRVCLDIFEQKMIPRKSLKSLKPNIYIDIDTKINEQNEILMNLQRQKVWNNSQNAKLELEVEALQRQLAAFLELERVEGKTSSSSALPVGETIGAKKVDVRVGSFKSNTGWSLITACSEIHKVNINIIFLLYLLKSITAKTS